VNADLDPVLDPVRAASAPQDNVTVMASAGTGKTWLLIARLIRLLLDGAEPGAILAITFTRKAAGEMQARLTERLSALARMDEAELTKQLHAIGATADEAGRRAARGLFERLLRTPYSVRTTTFHAFCQEILRRFPLDADVPPGFEVTEDGGLLEQEALDALYNEATAAPQGTSAQALDELSRRGRSPVAVAGALREFLQHRGDWWAYTQAMDDAPAGAAADLAARLGVEPGARPEAAFFTPAIEGALGEFCGLLQRHATAGNGEHAGLLCAALEQARPPEERLALAREVFFTAKGEPRKRKESAAQKKALQPEGEARFLALHAGLVEALAQVEDRRRRLATYTLSRAWYRAGARLLDIYQQIKRDRRLLDFNDLEWKTYTLLNHSDNAHWVQYKLDQRIDHLLIDEFQDTNPTQWRLLLPLLEELAAGGERRRSVFLVGDVKQSIYRFRRADPALFTTAHDWLRARLDGKGYPLNASWRSAPRIVEFINRVCGGGELHARLTGFEPHVSRRAGLWGRVEVLPLIQPVESAAGEPPVHTAPVLRDPLEQPRAEEPDRCHYREGRAIAAKIAELIAGGAIADRDHAPRAPNYGDIMILTRNRTHMRDYELALRDAGIPYLGGGRSSLLDSLEIQDMTALLEVLITPYDNLALATVLRSPLFGCDDADLIALAGRARGGGPGTSRAWLHHLATLAPALPVEAPLRRAWARLQDWRMLADRMPVHDLLDHIYCEAGVPACYLAAFPRHLHPRVQSNLMRFLELALEIESGRYPSIPRFIAALRELHRHAQQALEEPPSQPGLLGVRLMTVHAAKGLESPVVFLVDAARGPAPARAFQALVEWPPAAARPQHFLLTGRKQEIDAHSAALLARQEAEEEREEANLLYVALTRACQYLYVSGCAPKNTRGLGWYGQIAARLADDPQRIASEGWMAADPALPAPVPSAGLTSSIAPDGIDARLCRPLAGSGQGGEIAPSAAESGPGAERTRTGATHPDIATGPAAAAHAEDRRRGTIIHRMLDLLLTAAAPTLPAVAYELGLDPDDPELAACWTEARAVVGHPGLRAWFDPACYVRAYSEVPITYEEHGRIVHGVIDRLVVHPAGLTLIDYKTRRDVAPDRLDLVAAAHREQLRLYRNGVRRLWPQQPVRVLLLFTAIAQVYDCTESLAD
jgi:ATP-dependent helicase/nuclease subunit A